MKYYNYNKNWIAIIGAEGCGIFKTKELIEMAKENLSYIRDINTLSSRDKAKQWIIQSLLKDGRKINTLKSFPRGTDRIISYQKHEYFLSERPIKKVLTKPPSLQ